MNPANVFAHPTCNPAGAALEPTPATTDNPGNMRFVPGTSGVVPHRRLRRPDRQLGRRSGHRCGRAGRPANRSTTRASAARTTRCRARVRTVGRCSARRRFTSPTSIDLTLGVRQHDQSGYSVNKAAIAGVTAPKPLDPNQFHVGDAFIGTDVTATYTPFEFDKLTSRMALQWQFTDNFMGYVSYAEGFNSGGVSAPTVGSDAPDPAVRAVDARELRDRHSYRLARRPAALQRDRVRHRLGRPPGRGRRQRPGHGRADPDAGHDERRRGGSERRGVRADVPADRELHDQPRLRRARYGVHGDQARHDDGPPAARRRARSSRKRRIRATRSASSGPRTRTAAAAGSRASTTTTRVSSGGRSRSCASTLTRRCRMATRRAATGAS